MVKVRVSMGSCTGHAPLHEIAPFSILGLHVPYFDGAMLVMSYCTLEVGLVQQSCWISSDVLAPTDFSHKAATAQRFSELGVFVAFCFNVEQVKLVDPLS